MKDVASANAKSIAQHVGTLGNSSPRILSPCSRRRDSHLAASGGTCAAAKTASTALLALLDPNMNAAWPLSLPLPPVSLHTPSQLASFSGVQVALLKLASALRPARRLCRNHSKTEQCDKEEFMPVMAMV